MQRSIQLLILLALLCCWAVFSPALSLAKPTQHAFLTLSQAKKSKSSAASPVQLELRESPEGSVATIVFKAPTPDKSVKDEEAPGGVFTLLLNDRLLLHEPFTGRSFRVERPVQLDGTAIGKHVLRCEVDDSAGNRHVGELSFTFDNTPVLTVSGAKSLVNVVDPEISLRFFADGGETTGIVDVSVNERVAGSFQVNVPENGKNRKLSAWLGKPLELGTLHEGRHLLRLDAFGTGGGETTIFVPFEVRSIPELRLVKDAKGRVTGLQALFQGNSAGYAGTVEVYFQRSVILSLQTEEPSLVLDREALRAAFAQHNLELPQGETSLVVCLRSAHMTENWQLVSLSF